MRVFVLFQSSFPFYILLEVKKFDTFSVISSEVVLGFPSHCCTNHFTVSCFLLKTTFIDLIFFPKLVLENLFQLNSVKSLNICKSWRKGSVEGDWTFGTLENSYEFKPDDVKIYLYKALTSWG